MAIIEGGNNPRSLAHVDKKGRVSAFSISRGEQSEEAIVGDSYNVNSGTLTLTSGNESGLLYLKNDSENREFIINRVFFNLGNSTGGSGDIEARIARNPSGGTLISAGTSKDPANFNFGSGKSVGADLLIGSEGSTVTGEETPDPFEFMLPTDAQRYMIEFQSIVIPRGSSLAILLTPQSGNTSMNLQVGCNFFLREVDL